MARAFSLNDVAPEICTIRRDQFKRIAGIVDVHRDRPILAIDLIRDYCKGIERVKHVVLHPVNDPNPTQIVVATEDTTYQFKLKKSPIVEPPTL